MKKWLAKHWKLALLTILALAAAIFCAVFPPTLVGMVTFGIAASAKFAVLGAHAYPMAQACVALTASALVYITGGVLIGLGKLTAWTFRGCRSDSRSVPSDSATAYAPVGDAALGSNPMSQLGGQKDSHGAVSRAPDTSWSDWLFQRAPKLVSDTGDFAPSGAPPLL